MLLTTLSVSISLQSRSLSRKALTLNIEDVNDAHHFKICQRAGFPAATSQAVLFNPTGITCLLSGLLAGTKNKGENGECLRILLEVAYNFVVDRLPTLENRNKGVSDGGFVRMHMVLLCVMYSERFVPLNSYHW
jgi:hypothetical protein